MGATCRFCANPLEHICADLGMAPLANSYLAPEQLSAMEPYYPLKTWVCSRCLLVQLEEFEPPERIFSEYSYFSSYSTSWLEHSRRFAAKMIEELRLDDASRVVELASNDGYLLQYFRDAHIRVLGIEPAANVAQHAIEHGVPTLVRFFGVATARELEPESAADLLIGNNVLAHVPDLNDFVAGMKMLLKPSGVITMEFPHVLRLISENQWDTIYHEHFSYFSFRTVRDVFAAHDLRVFDVEELPTHGGSLRIYGCHASDESKPEAARALRLLEQEREAGLDRVDTYVAFGERVRREKLGTLEFLIGLWRQGLRIVGYGAPAKGNTLLNYCGVGPELVEYTCDLNVHKQGRFLPGSHIPIRSPESIMQDRPDIVLILPWNLRHEIMEQLSFIRDWGGRFAVRAPEWQLSP